ncbi:ATP-binding cassette domain-containing protein [uncultured Piscinibacter sp.]|uniref:ATP-binding cassette domain-containing protein n=1 Tax=uncultured Piscinibacter sp. TaxID=1131835 RepID=UPI002606936A|nr:ATP-binding cassette domain-containing protein [uncultured Piscinibacter sp.]
MAGPEALTAGCAEPMVRVDGLVKRYRHRQALAGVSLHVARGELYGLIGADGAGKSSLFKAVAGVLSFEGGSLRVLGQDLASEADAERIKQRIGFMPQGLGLNLYPELSVDENVDFFADLRGVPPRVRQERKARLLAMTRLEAFRARPMKQLSGGMKQKLGLVCTLIHEPELIVLDEPTTGVDPLSRRDFWQLLPELVHERGMTALVATAYLDEASHFDRVGLMYGGTLLAEGEPERLPQQLAATVVVAADASADTVQRLARAFGPVDRHGASASVLVPTPDAGVALAQVRSVLPGAPRAELQALPPSLEDLVVARVRERTPQAAQPVTATAGHAGEGNAGAAAPPCALEAIGLTRDYDGFRAADRVSFRVARGEIFGLLGANGAGKTTVIKMLTGILPPTAGVGQVAGADMRRASRQIRQRIGYMSQAFSLYADLSVRDNLMLYAGVYGLVGRSARERTAWAIELGALSAHLDDAAASLPMGLRQRLALGCALLHRPGVLILDEPTSGVDPLGRRHFWNILSWLAREEGVAILLSTHHMAEAELCDHLVLLFEGRVVADASPLELKQRLRQHSGELLEVRCDDPSRALQLLREAGHADAMLRGHGVLLMAVDRAQAEARIAALLGARQITLQAVLPREIGMDDVFVREVGALQARAP